MAKISKKTCYRRTRVMIARDKGVPLDTVVAQTKLREVLLYTDASLSRLEIPIETEAFADVNANVAPSRLRRARTVLGIVGVIWRGIPDANRT